MRLPKLYNVLYSLPKSRIGECDMDEPFFPIKAQRVVPLVKIEDNDEVTRVQTSKRAFLSQSPKLRIIRFAFASLFRLTIVEIDTEDSKSKH